MTDTENTDQAADDTTEAPDVAVPNVRPGARSGLDHTPLNAARSTLVGSARTQDPAEQPDQVDDATREDLGPEAAQVTSTPSDPPQPGADADGFGGDAPEPAVDQAQSIQDPGAGDLDGGTPQTDSGDQPSDVGQGEPPASEDHATGQE